ncbi:hypothetical protein BT96DRAFT_949267 [Gymnopus androsaceus JB14]|uniref:Uncharacterized protein n=1 Tax=Gymnopus androsaceus JB14 TaxID=1447944 RepID=A0A6A4GL96_9AGAR|nr:hypothetical protein BT96DRAFT_949267 [Gymnopus androsaceus JB14]
MPFFSHQTAHSGIERSKTTRALGMDLHCWEEEPVQIGAGFLNMTGVDISFSEEIPRGTPEQYYGRLFIGNHKPNVEPCVASRDATFEIFSYNSRQNPYYRGRHKPEDYWKPFTSPTFTDGSMGKTDPTLMPQFYDRRFPSLPFVRLLEYAEKDLLKCPEYENLYEVWQSETPLAARLIHQTRDILHFSGYIRMHDLPSSYQ